MTPGTHTQIDRIMAGKRLSGPQKRDRIFAHVQLALARTDDLFEGRVAA